MIKQKQHTQPPILEQPIQRIHQRYLSKKIKLLLKEQQSQMKTYIKNAKVARQMKKSAQALKKIQIQHYDLKRKQMEVRKSSILGNISNKNREIQGILLQGQGQGSNYCKQYGYEGKGQGRQYGNMVASSPAYNNYNNNNNKSCTESNIGVWHHRDPYTDAIYRQKQRQNNTQQQQQQQGYKYQMNYFQKLKSRFKDYI